MHAYYDHPEQEHKEVSHRASESIGALQAVSIVEAIFNSVSKTKSNSTAELLSVAE